jgi:enamine deaminase RidA (YjgF/YER057c/UK114 family)
VRLVLEDAGAGWSNIVDVTVFLTKMKNDRNTRSDGKAVEHWDAREVLMKYLDGYVLPVPKKNLPAYRRMAQEVDSHYCKVARLGSRL